MSDKMSDEQVLREDEIEALKNAEDRQRLNMAYREDKKALLLRDRLIKARRENLKSQQALGEIVTLTEGGGDPMQCIDTVLGIARKARGGE